MHSAIIYSITFGIATFLILAFVIPAFLWANMPQPEIDHLRHIALGCCIAGAALGAWIGWRLTRH